MRSDLQNISRHTPFADIKSDDVNTARETLKAMATAAGYRRDSRRSSRRSRASYTAAVARYHPSDVLNGSVSDEELRVAFLLGEPSWSAFLFAISASSVLWGACTYIGNGPNLMIKSIADAAAASARLTLRPTSGSTACPCWFHCTSSSGRFIYGVDFGVYGIDCHKITRSFPPFQTRCTVTRHESRPVTRLTTPPNCFLTRHALCIKAMQKFSTSHTLPLGGCLCAEVPATFCSPLQSGRSVRH